jgi:hypothetical protein
MAVDFPAIFAAEDSEVRDLLFPERRFEAVRM